MDNPIHERVVLIRKTLGMKQGSFAQSLGMPQTTFSSIENGKSPLQERHIKLICLTFSIHETWLRTGEGVMFTEEIPGWQELLSTFQQLSPEMRNIIRGIARLLLTSQESSAPAPDKRE